MSMASPTPEGYHASRPAPILVGLLRSATSKTQGGNISKDKN